MSASSIAPAKSQLDDTLTSTYYTLKSSPNGLGKKEKAFDKLGNNVTSAWSTFDSFYNSNRVVIATAQAGILSLDDKTINDAMNGFRDTVNIVLRGLDELGKIHPFAQVAVTAFKLVVTLDMTRRDNNQKVDIMKIEMMQMMCTLFQLRDIRDPDVVAPDGQIIKERMRPLMEAIASDIEACGSFCDYYCKKNVVSRTLKSKLYEGRFTDFVRKFADNQDKIDKALTIHIALKVDSTASEVHDINQKLDQLFRRFDTPQERGALEFIEKNGGPKTVVESNDLVEGLFKLSGESQGKFAGKGEKEQVDIATIKGMLRKEIAENIDVSMKEHFTLFKSMLEMQEQNIGKMTDYLIRTISSGTHDKILDKNLQNLWKEMGWKGSVKAIRFAYALRDYFTGQFDIANPPKDDVSTTSDEASSDNGSKTQDGEAPGLAPHETRDDKWALNYLQVSHLQPILEAIDDDATGFISIKEANMFALERPTGWSLLEWLAFWAKGWEMSLARYKKLILRILQEMNRLRDKALEVNGHFADVYFRDCPIVTIELLLQSVKATDEDSDESPALVSLTSEFMAAEENRLRANLEKFGYKMVTPSMVTLVTGLGRIERFLFPLLYVILKRHLAIFHYASRHVLSNQFQFFSGAWTLDSVFEVVFQRIKDLKVVHRQMRTDFAVHLEHIALGMFRDCASQTDTLFGSKDNLIMTWEDTANPHSNFEEASPLDDPANASLLIDLKPPLEWPPWPPHSFSTNPYGDSLEGFWTGRIRSTNEYVDGYYGLELIQLTFEIDTADSVTLRGFAVTWSGWLGVKGRIDRIDEKEWDGSLSLVLSWTDGRSVKLAGLLNIQDEVITGKWDVFEEDEEGKGDEEDDGKDREGSSTASVTDTAGSEVPVKNEFELRRSPAEIYHLRSLLVKEDKSKAKSRWDFACASVLHLVRQRLWSLKYLDSWTTDRRKFLDFYKCELLVSHSSPQAKGLSQEDRDEWKRLKEKLTPGNIQVCVENFAWYFERQLTHFTVYCDGCLRVLGTDTRYVCLECLDPDIMADSFDLCSTCADSKVFIKNSHFTHIADHPLIEARRPIHLHAFRWTIEMAKQTIGNIRNELSSSEKSTTDDGPEAVSSGEGPRCCRCENLVTLPFWVCFNCSCGTQPKLRSYFLCADCHEKGPITSKNVIDGHREDHHLLRFTSLSQFDNKSDPTLERITGMEVTVDKRFGALEMVVDKRFEALEGRIESLEGRIGVLEGLLHKISAQLDVSISNSSQ